MRVLVVIGTRPEAIKMAPVIHALNGGGVRAECCLTSQHTDLIRPMLDFFRVPVDFDLKVMTSAQTLPDVAAKILQGTAEILRRNGPYQAVLVQGDTTTAFAAGLAGFYERVKVGHVEAGLRSFDLNHPFPEEAHRQFVDVFADFLFAPTLQARTNLLNAGADPARIFVTGNTGIDALLMARGRVAAERHPLPAPIPDGHRVLLLTAHRRESFGPPLARVFEAVVALTESHPDLTVLAPLHPNPRVREAAAVLAGRPRILALEPLQYPDFVAAMDRADVILTDSGGVQEEAPVLGKPILVTRETTERPEGVSAGAAELVGTDPERIIARVTALLAEAGAPRPPMYLYGDGKSAERIAQVLRHGRMQSATFRAVA